MAAGNGYRWEMLEADWGMKKGENDLDPLYGRRSEAREKGVNKKYLTKKETLGVAGTPLL